MVFPQREHHFPLFWLFFSFPHCYKDFECGPLARNIIHCTCYSNRKAAFSWLGRMFPTRMFCCSFTNGRKRWPCKILLPRVTFGMHVSSSSQCQAVVRHGSGTQLACAVAAYAAVAFADAVLRDCFLLWHCTSEYDQDSEMRNPKGYGARISFTGEWVRDLADVSRRGIG